MIKFETTHIARVATVPLFVVTHLSAQLAAIADSGASVTVITSPDELSMSLPSTQYRFKPVYIARKIHLLSDLISLIKLVKLFRKERYHIVHSTTPKAGLLCALAAKLAGVPIRLHTYTGQTWITLSGFKKTVVKFCDKLIGGCNTHCYADSTSQKEFLIKNKIIKQKNISVLGSGSLSGVDIKRFEEANFPKHEKIKIRTQLGIKAEIVLLFLGRITKDKGIFELIESFSQLLQENLSLKLIIAGPFEDNLEQSFKAYAQQLCGSEKVLFLKFCEKPENLIAITDILCLPSYREGFGTVAIEAAAMGVPTVGTKIYGLTDAIVDGQTGLLVEPRNTTQLTRALKTLISNEQLRVTMGQHAKERAIKEFDSRIVSHLVVNEYSRLLSEYKENKL